MRDSRIFRLNTRIRFAQIGHLILRPLYRVGRANEFRHFLQVTQTSSGGACACVRTRSRLGTGTSERHPEHITVPLSGAWNNSISRPHLHFIRIMFPRFPVYPIPRNNG